jgi:hypothetical protein
LRIEVSEPHPKQELPIGEHVVDQAQEMPTIALHAIEHAARFSGISP